MDTVVAPGFSNIGYRVRRRAWEPITESLLRAHRCRDRGHQRPRERPPPPTSPVSGPMSSWLDGIPTRRRSVQAEIASTTGRDTVRPSAGRPQPHAEVRDLATRLLANEPAVHVLVNNAGTLFPERSSTAEGIESTLATNLLGHFLLTNLLIPKLVESAPARIINVSSGGMYGQRISISNLQNDRGEYKGSAAYARTKRGQVILTEMWAEQPSTAVSP